MKNYLYFSSLLHFILLAMLVFVPNNFSKIPDEKQHILQIDILQVADIVNVPKEEEQQEKLPDVKDKKTPKTAVKAAAKAEPVPSLAPKKKQQEITKSELKTENKPQPKLSNKRAKKSASEEELDTLLKTLEETKSQKVEEKIKSVSYESEKPLTVSEIEALRSQLAACWTIPAGARDIEDLSILLRISVRKDGSVSEVKLVEGSTKLGQDSFFKVAVDSAIRAVRKCSPLKNLPIEKYEIWKELEINFDPKEMIY